MYGRESMNFPSNSFNIYIRRTSIRQQQLQQKSAQERMCEGDREKMPVLSISQNYSLAFKRKEEKLERTKYSPTPWIKQNIVLYKIKLN